MAVLQCTVDDELEIRAASIYEKLGIDLQTAIRIFLKKSVMINGIPFAMIVENDTAAKNALNAMKAMQAISEKNGNYQMSIDDIDEEIHLARLERRRKTV